MFSYPRPGINPAYYQEGTPEPLWEFNREAAKARARAASEEFQYPVAEDDLLSEGSAHIAPDAPRRVEVQSKSYTRLVVDAAHAHTRTIGAKEPHPPAHKSPMRLKHIKRIVDRGGGVRNYYVRGPKPHFRLPDHEGTPAFLQAYEDARREKTRQWRRCQQPVKRARTIKDLVDLYLRSKAYAGLRPGSQRVYGRVLRRLMQDEQFASFSVAGLRRRHVQRLVDRHSGTPAGAADLLKKLRALLRCAIAHGWRSDDPTQGVKLASGNDRGNCADASPSTCKPDGPRRPSVII